MTILASDLRFFQSERMTDNDDGGGRMSGVEIAAGNTSRVFDDISDVDRAAGDCSIRKIYATVTSDTADKYLDAGVVIMKPPADPNASVLLFSTGSFYDEHSALRNKIESSIVRGSVYTGFLWGDHNSGQRAVTIWQRPTSEIPSTGRRLELASYTGSTQTASQTLWIVKITESIVTKYDGQGLYQIRRIVCELAEALRYDFSGTEPARYDPSVSALLARLYDTRYNAGAFPVCGIKPLADAAQLTDFSIKVSGGLYSPLIPTAFSETAIPDATPGGDSLAIVAAGDNAATFTTALNVVGPSKSLFVGSGVQPGSLTIAASGMMITDSGGKLLASGVERGVINYGTGVCTFNADCPSAGTTAKTVSFKPAASPLRVADTASQVVTVENRGFIWVITLLPVPAPNTLRISYRVSNVWYTISDTGNGQLSGADSSYGSATLDLTTGTVVLQTGELPDVDSEIIYAWCTAVNYIKRTGSSVHAPTVNGTTANQNVLPGTVTVTWTDGTTTFELTDSEKQDGKLVGTGGKGAIGYKTGVWWVLPDKVPIMGAEFSINYRWGEPSAKITDTFDALALDSAGNLTLSLSQEPERGSVSIQFPVEVTDRYGEITTVDTVKLPNGEPVVEEDGSLNGSYTIMFAAIAFTNPSYGPVCRGIAPAVTHLNLAQAKLMVKLLTDLNITTTSSGVKDETIQIAGYDFKIISGGTRGVVLSYTVSYVLDDTL